MFRSNDLRGGFVVAVLAMFMVHGAAHAGPPARKLEEIDGIATVGSHGRVRIGRYVVTNQPFARIVATARGNVIRARARLDGDTAVVQRLYGYARPSYARTYQTPDRSKIPIELWGPGQAVQITGATPDGKWYKHPVPQDEGEPEIGFATLTPVVGYVPVDEVTFVKPKPASPTQGMSGALERDGAP